LARKRAPAERVGELPRVGKTLHPDDPESVRAKQETDLIGQVVFLDKSGAVSDEAVAPAYELHRAVRCRLSPPLMQPSEVRESIERRKDQNRSSPTPRNSSQHREQRRYGLVGRRNEGVYGEDDICGGF
jgi:hypothetical protein